MTDVWPGIFNYGILLVPKDIRPDERRPVVICQHGLESTCQEVADPGFESRNIINSLSVWLISASSLTLRKLHSWEPNISGSISELRIL